MAASFPLAAMLAVACSFVALLPASAAPVWTLQMGPHGVTDDTKTWPTDVTSDQDIENLRDTFVGENSDMLLRYIISHAKKRAAPLASDTATRLSVQVDIDSNIHRRFPRSPDSTSAYSANPQRVDAANVSLNPTAESTGYQASDELLSPYSAYPYGIAKYAPAHYVPPAARNLGRNLSLVEAITPARSLASDSTPTLAFTPLSASARTPASASSPTINHSAAPARTPDLANTPEIAQPPTSEYLKAIMDIWNRFLTEPRQENYDKFVALLPAKSVQSLLLNHQHFDFKSVQDYRADKEGFISAMQKVYQVPEEQLEEVGNFFDMMTQFLPSKYFDKGRNVADLVRQIRFYFARKHPRVKVMASETVARYYLK